MTNQSARDRPGGAPRSSDRIRRTLLLLAALLGIVGGAAFLVQHREFEVLKVRARRELAHRFDRSLNRAHEALERKVAILEVLASQDSMTRILDGDADSVLHEALGSTKRSSDEFESLTCLTKGVDNATNTATEYVVAATRAPGSRYGAAEPLDSSVRDALLGGQRATVRAESGGLVASVPVSLFDGDISGFIVARVPLASLLSAEGMACLRIEDSAGVAIAERRAIDLNGSEVARSKPTEFSRRAFTPPSGVDMPPWVMAAAGDLPRRLSERQGLTRSIWVLAAVASSLVTILVLVFSRKEALLYRALNSRAEDLLVAHQRLDRSQADLVKAARMAGMSEIATGVLHTVGNLLNSLNVGMREASLGQAAATVREQGRLMTHLQSNEDPFACSIRSHPKGPPFVEYLEGLTTSLSSEIERTIGELESVRGSVDEVIAIVTAQAEFATQTSLIEETDAREMFEGAIALSRHAFAADERLVIAIEDSTQHRLRVYRHRVMEILFAVVNNARQSLDAAIGGASELRLEVLLRARWIDEATIRFEVVDNGPGIAEEHRDLIFNHGFTTRDGAKGFGLHAAANAATELGGRLFADHTLSGRGATFVLEIPVERAAQSEPLDREPLAIRLSQLSRERDFPLR